MFLNNATTILKFTVQAARAMVVLQMVVNSSAQLKLIENRLLLFGLQLTTMKRDEVSKVSGTDTSKFADY